MIIKTKEIMKLLIPPILILIARKFKLHTTREQLFNGRDSSLFLENAYNALIYGEYGIGYSTESIRNQSDSVIIAVETNKIYLDTWKNKLELRVSDNVFYINIGDIQGLGYPKNYSQKDSFIEYFESIWRYTNKPDFVLIDGRFRVACFLTSLVFSDPGTKILFDDYDREYYHVIEEIIFPVAQTETQALFVRPEFIDYQKTISLRDAFSMVMV